MHEIDGIPVKECVGCGWCCWKTPCWVSIRIHGTAIAPCPELRWNGTRHVCKLMEMEGQLGANYRKELFAGEGCCANLNSWRRDIRNRVEVKVEEEPVRVPAEMQIFMRVLGGEFISGDVMSLTMMNFKHLLVEHGYTEERAVAYTNECVHWFNQNRRSYMKDFMG